MKLILITALFIVHLPSCRNSNEKKANNLNYNQSNFKNIVFNDSAYQISFSIPNEIVEITNADEIKSKKTENSKLLRVYANQTGNINIFIRRNADAYKYMGKLNERFYKDSVDIRLRDTIIKSTFINYRFFYRNQKLSLIYSKNIILPNGADNNLAYIIDYVMPISIDSTRQKIIGFSLESISVKKN